MQAVGKQREFLFRPNTKQQDISDDIIARQPTWKDALFLCKSVSGLDDKQICNEMDVDPAQWSRIWSGQANFPDKKILKFMDVCGNLIPLRWLALHCGQGIHPLKSTLEIENEQLKAALDQANHEKEVIIKTLREVNQR